MRILVISDLHCSKDFLRRFKYFLSREKFDLCLIPGDLTNHSRFALDYIQDLSQIFRQKSLQWYCVHGNNDSPQVIDFLIGAKRNLHYESQIFNNYRLLGIGGWGSDLPHYPLDLDQNTIFLTHIPPKIPHQKHTQPKQLAHAPLLHLSGHLHHRADYRDLGITRIVQIPTAQDFRAAIIHLPSRKIEFIDLPPVPNL